MKLKYFGPFSLYRFSLRHPLFFERIISDMVVWAAPFRGILNHNWVEKAFCSILHTNVHVRTLQWSPDPSVFNIQMRHSVALKHTVRSEATVTTQRSVHVTLCKLITPII